MDILRFLFFRNFFGPRQRKHNGKAASLARFALYGSGTLHQLYEIGHDGKAQPESVLCHGIAKTLERGEDLFLFFFRDTCSGILHGQGEQSVLVIRMECDAAAAGKLERVGKQVASDAQYALLVAAQHLCRPVVCHEFDALGFRQRGELRFQYSGYGPRAERTDVQLLFPVFQPEKFQQFGGHGSHAVRGLTHDAYVACLVFRGFIPEQKLCISAYCRQGSAQFVTDGLHQVTTKLQQLPVLLVARLQFVDKSFAFFLFAEITSDFPVDGDMEQDQKEDGGGQSRG